MSDSLTPNDDELQFLNGQNPPAGVPVAPPSASPPQASTSFAADPNEVSFLNQAPAPPPPSTVYQGSVLPLSKDSEGNIHFDPNAGIVGSIKRAFTLPGEVYSGQVDPTSDEGARRALEMATVVTPVNPAVRAGEMAIPGMALNVSKAPVTPPTADALRSAAESGYDAARNLGVQYSSGAVADMANAAQRSLEERGIIPEVAPKSFAVLGKLQTPPEGSTAPLAGLDAARSAFGNVAKDNPGSREQVAALSAQGAIDDFVSKADPSTVVAGPASTAADILSNARGNYAAAMRSDKVSGIEDAAELRASVANSGQNLDNSIRQRAAAILLKPKEAYGFSPDELGALKDVASGTPSRNALRFVGNILGGGGGLGSVVSGGAGGLAGSAIGGPVVGAMTGAAVPALGMAAKKTANALTSKALNVADEIVRQRSPLYNQMSASAPFIPNNIPPQNAALARGLMTSGNQDQTHRSNWLKELANYLITPAQ